MKNKIAEESLWILPQADCGPLSRYLLHLLTLHKSDLKKIRKNLKIQVTSSIFDNIRTYVASKLKPISLSGSRELEPHVTNFQNGLSKCEQTFIFARLNISEVTKIRFEQF